MLGLEQRCSLSLEGTHDFISALLELNDKLVDSKMIVIIFTDLPSSHPLTFGDTTV